MKKQVTIKIISLFTLVCATIMFNIVKAKADSTPHNLDGTDVTARTTCATYNATAATYADTYNPYVTAEVSDVRYYMKDYSTGTVFLDYFSPYSNSGQSSTSLFLSPISGCVSHHISSHHKASKPGVIPWETDTSDYA